MKPRGVIEHHFSCALSLSGKEEIWLDGHQAHRGRYGEKLVIPTMRNNLTGIIEENDFINEDVGGNLKTRLRRAVVNR